MDNQATGDAGEDTPAFSQSAREKLEEESFQRYIDSRKAQNSWYKLLEKSSRDMCEIQLTAWIRMVTGILFFRMTSILSSAGGIISLLDESQEELQVYALQRLNEESIIRQFWVSLTF